ncbi:MAG: hypothetical protein KKI02_11535 [Planctomycetes bacterium]|nr:hypothetical protein [Planctomycetota bacterium]
MDSDPSSTAAPDGPAAIDTGLRCPECEYNLTGLADPRCPECGTTFDWEDVRQAAECPPRIAFERAKGWPKIPALLVTWATVLFAPWIFARQIVQQVSATHATAFLVVCFAVVLSRVITDWSDREVFLAWTATGVIHVILQAVLMSTIDPHGWREPLGTLRFWLLAGCYTSAVVPTECTNGPPLLMFLELDDALRNVITLGWIDEPLAWLVLAQFGLWLWGLTFIYTARLRRRWPTPAVLLALLFALPALVVLHSLSVEFIGMPLWKAFGGSVF